MKLLEQSVASCVLFLSFSLLSFVSQDAPARVGAEGRRYAVEPQEDVKLTIFSEKEIYMAEEPITLQFELKNTGPEILRIEEHNLLYDFDLDIRNGSGKKVTSKAEETAENSGGRLKYKKDGISARLLELRPGEEQTLKLHLRTHFSLAPGDSYSITARRKIERVGGNGGQEVVSNAIHVTVLP
jgi:hypothetical protein